MAARSVLNIHSVFLKLAAMIVLSILTTVAVRLADRLSLWNAVNQSNATLARLGGDEFTVLQRRVDDISSTEGLAKEILEALSEPVDSAEHSFSVGASIGITTCPADGP